MSEKIKASGKFNGKYIDYCDEFDPSEANVNDSMDNGRAWNAFEVPNNEAEHIAKPNSDVDLNRVLARAKAKKLGVGILNMNVWA